MNDVPWYLSYIVAWAPFLFLIGLVVWMTLTMRNVLRTHDRRSLADAVDAYARELRRSNDLFAEALKNQQRLAPPPA
jgi:hypothetical protein